VGYREANGRRGHSAIIGRRRHLDEERSMPEDVKAHITGVVFQITSKPGDAVEAGDPIIVLESMKMEIPVEAPRAGRVVEIVVAEGQTVQEGDTVAVLE
jgi:urea carboxylase